jgi:hypothetical protein
MSAEVERAYRVVGICRAGPAPTVIIQVNEDDPLDTGETPTEWVGDPSQLKRGRFFSYFDAEERAILERGFELTLKKTRR